MKLSEFNNNMPNDLIATHPSENRDEARLLVLHRKTGEIEHRIFKEIIHYFDDQDTFIFNDTQVFPRGRTLRFLYDGDHDEFKQNLYALGSTPLPYYIKREAEPEDAELYQTIFARNEGAVVAPAAGMHFSRELLKRMEIKGIHDEYITVHIGLGSFRNIDVEDLTKHRMDSEQMIISEEVSERVNKRRDNGHKVCAIGVSTLRAMESSVSMNGHIKPFDGWTNKFIFPPYDFTTADALVTNFHMPYSVMLMLTCAFGGYDQVMNAYKVAIDEKYQFGAYGDAMLILD